MARMSAVDGGRHGGKRGHQVRILEGDQKYGNHKKNHKSDHIDIDGTNHVVVDGLAVHLDLLDALRVDVAGGAYGKFRLFLAFFQVCPDV